MLQSPIAIYRCLKSLSDFPIIINIHLLHFSVFTTVFFSRFVTLYQLCFELVTLPDADTVDPSDNFRATVVQVDADTGSLPSPRQLHRIFMVQLAARHHIEIFRYTTVTPNGEQAVNRSTARMPNVSNKSQYTELRIASSPQIHSQWV
jgi:hypothetical protein